MLVVPSPFFVDDIVATGTADFPVSVDCAAQGRVPRPLGQGWLRAECVQPGMVINAAEYAAFEDYAVHNSIDNGLFVGVNLGAREFGETGKLSWELTSGEVVALRMREPLPSRQARVGGTQLMRCGVWLEDDWLASGRLDEMEVSSARIRGLLLSHLKPWQAQASETLLASARRLTVSMTMEGALGRLRRETAGLNFLHQALALMSPDAAYSLRSPSDRDLKRLKHVRDLLDDLGAQDGVSLADIAAAVGMSVRSLSRHFRSAFGITVLTYVAEARMEKARKVLERGEGSIDLAAYVAGFAHTANFTRAFKRRYGCTPGSLTARSSPRVGRRK